MSIKIVSVTRLDLQVATLIYQNLEVATLSYSNPSITTAFFDPNAPNRFVHELAAAVDDYLINVSLAKTDAMNASDAYVWALSKAVDEITTLTDAFLMEVDKSLVDTATVAEIFRLSLNKVFADNDTSVTDSFDVRTIKSTNDLVIASELFSMVTSYVRHFIDYVSMDDFVGFDKQYNGVKHNVVGATDAINYISTTKRVADSTSFAADLVIMQYSKGATDAAIVSDAFNVSYVPGNLMLLNNIPFNESTLG